MKGYIVIVPLLILAVILFAIGEPVAAIFTLITVASLKMISVIDNRGVNHD